MMGIYYTDRRKGSFQASVKRYSLSLRDYRKSFHFRILVILFTLLLAQSMVKVEAVGQLIVNDYGVTSAKPGDTALVFYANITYNGSKGDNAIVARLQMAKCCVQDDGAENCQVMKLISGLAVIFRPKNSHRLLLFFLNSDLHDRVGRCDVNLLTKTVTPGHSAYEDGSWKRGAHIKIPFKTDLPKRGRAFSLVGGHTNKPSCNFKSYNSLKACTKLDECLIRNSGVKSLVNVANGTCSTTPPCKDSSKHFLSLASHKCQKSHDVALDQKSFTYEMTHTDGIPSFVREHSKHLKEMLRRANLSQKSNSHKQVICQNGIFTDTPHGYGNCTCFPGWRSMTLEEWKRNGGLLGDGNDAPIPQLCTVPLRQMKERKYLVIVVVVLGLASIFIITLLYNLRLQKTPRIRGKKQIGDQERGATSSSSSSSDDDNDKDSQLARYKSNLKLKSLEDAEADEVILEVTNRREPRVSKRSSKSGDKDEGDGGNDNSGNPTTEQIFPIEPPETPLPKELPSSMPNETSSPANATTPEQQNAPTQSRPPPQAKTKASPSQGQHSAYLSNYFIDPYEADYFSDLRAVQKHPSTEQLSLQASSRGFTFSESDDSDNVFEKMAERRILPLMDSMLKMFAHSAPSTDDLLDLKPQEKSAAHVPMTPRSSLESCPSVVVTNGSLVELKEHNVNVNRLSAEQITHIKKDQWADFMVSMNSDLAQPGSKFGAMDPYEDDSDSDSEDYTQERPADFDYFNRGHKARAAKARSVPVMMQYHTFQSAEPIRVQPALHNVFEDMFQETKVASPNSECFRTLSNISKPKMCSSAEKSVNRTKNSIWSNTASENTSQESIISKGPRVTFAARRDSPIAEDYDGELLRIKTIYGDSDVDSDAALEEMERDSFPAGSSFHNSVHGPVCNDRPVSPGASGNRTVHGHQHHGMGLSSSFSPIMKEINENFQPDMTSDRIASEAYVGAPTQSQSIDDDKAKFWKLITTTTLGENIAVGSSPGPYNEQNIHSFPTGQKGMGAEAMSAYQLKSTLDTFMKARKTQSETELS